MIDLLLVIALLASLFMGISIGASSVAPAFGPVNSARSTNVLRAALLSGIFAFIGSVVQGANVTNTVGSGLVAESLTLTQGTSILIVASVLVILSVLKKYPMPTAFTVVGAVLGSAYGFGNGINMFTVQKVFAYWLIIPFVALILSYINTLILRRAIPEEGEERKIRYLLIASGSYMAYTAGAGSVGLAIGPLTSLDASSMILLWFGGFSILAGAWMYSPRIIRAVSFDYSNIGPRRSIAALGTAAILAQIGIFFGIPISFNEAIIASVIGSGLVEGKANTEKGKILKTGLAWIGTFFLAFLLTMTVGLAITSF